MIRGDLAGLGLAPVTITQGDPDSFTDEVQQITVSHPAGFTGQFRLTFLNGDDPDNTTDPLDLGASAGDVQTALNGLSTIGGIGGSVSVVKAVVGDDDVYTVTFGGALGSVDVSQIIGKIEQDGADILNVQSIRETTLFPRDLHRLTP